MITRKIKRPRRQWSWRFGRRDGQPGIIERQNDGLWHVFIGRTEIGRVATEEAARKLIDKIDAGPAVGVLKPK
jgi:hypothetical protein